MNSQGFGGLYVAANSSLEVNAAPTTGTVLTSTNCAFTAIAAGSHGDLSVVATTTSGKLTCKPGVYLVTLELTIEGEWTSTTSGDALGVISAVIKQAGTAVTGAKSKVQAITEGLPMNVSVTAILEVTQAQADAGTNYFEAALIGGDASGNDVIVSEGRFHAIRLY
jgi:hypothetical protein